MATVAGVVGLLAGCSTVPTPNDADRSFVAQLISHHHLGMELVDEATVHSSDVRLRRLVFDMSGSHADRWRVTAATDFPGDLAAASVDRLAVLTGADHDTWWLHLMIEHHRGALALAATQLGSGQVRAVIDLARTVQTVQSREVTAMEQLLSEFCGETPVAAGCATK